MHPLRADLQALVTHALLWLLDRGNRAQMRAGSNRRHGDPLLTFSPVCETYQEFAGREALARLRDSAVDAAELSIELPRRLDRLLGEVERGNLRVWTRLEDVEPLMKRVEHLGERLNTTMLAAACIVALADRKSTRLNSSHGYISYAVFC